MITDFQKLVPSIKERLRQHHSLYPFIKVRDYLWEYTLFMSIQDSFPNWKPQWDYGSQKIGKDITLEEPGVDISCKSGQIHPDERIKISSSRLSRFGDDLDMIKSYLATTKTDDYIFCLSTRKTKGSLMFDDNIEYIFSVYSSDAMDYPNVTWDFFGKDRNLVGYSPQNVKITVTKAMGWQVWYYMPLTVALHSEVIKL